MRAILYAGTRGCDTTVDEVLAGHVDPVHMLVPADPRTLAAEADDREALEDARAVADLVLERGLARVRQVVSRERASLGGVFGKGTDPHDLPVGGGVVEGDLEDGLARALQEADARELWVSREALEVLGAFGIDVAAVLDDAGLELEAR